MSEQKKGSSPQARLGILSELVRNARLAWRLMRDRRISFWLKTIVPATLVYVIYPIDFIPDALLGLGQLDDLAIIMMGVKLFLNLCPSEIVKQHLEEMRSVRASYRVVDDEERDANDDPRSYIEGSYRIVDDPDQDS